MFFCCCTTICTIAYMKFGQKYWLTNRHLSKTINFGPPKSGMCQRQRSHHQQYFRMIWQYTTSIIRSVHVNIVVVVTSSIICIHFVLNFCWCDYHWFLTISQIKSLDAEWFSFLIWPSVGLFLFLFSLSPFWGASMQYYWYQASLPRHDQMISSL